MPKQTKSLTINDIVYAHYEIEKDTIFIKIRNNIIPDSIRNSEDLFILIISLIEKQNFTKAAHLNIE